GSGAGGHKVMTYGLEGENVLKVDGPYAAPCQHIGEYDVVLLTAAGIGLTPFSSTLQSIINHRWASGQPPRDVHFHWSCRFTEVEAYLWFMRLISDLHKSYKVRRANQETVVFSVTLYLTGESTDAELAGLCETYGLTYAASGQQVDPDEHIIVKKGRPNWEQVFAGLAKRYKDHHIGVFHCGPMGKDLNYHSRTQSRILTNRLHGERENTRFTLHAEVF
ncbi:hypothetical protein CYMTET_51828, partial [Cymbomonas tetramitiformis]